MEATDYVYEEGCRAGRNGATEEDNPYPKNAVHVIDKDGKSHGYFLSNHDRWEMGRQRGVKCCPHCNGTGIKE